MKATVVGELSPRRGIGSAEDGRQLHEGQGGKALFMEGMLLVLLFLGCGAGATYGAIVVFAATDTGRIPVGTETAPSTDVRRADESWQRKIGEGGTMMTRRWELETGGDGQM